MKNWNRRRVLQAGLAVGGGALLGTAWTQDNRTLQVGPRPAGPLAPGAAPGAPLLIAPRRALVIGNSAYAVGPLRNPANDARAVAEELKKQGFEVTLGLDLKRDEMLNLIGAYGQPVASAKPVALFYYAGHGLQLSWRNYLVPVDAVLKSAQDVPARCVDVNAVIERMGKAANPMNVIILDACRDDPYGRAEQKGLSQLDAPPGTLLAFATSPGNVASDGAGANGLYTEHLLREIQVPEAKIEDVFKRVRLGVRRGSNGRQIPWESTSLEEDFWFIPPPEALRLAREEGERLRREQEAERLRAEQLERARQEERERLRREQEAERARAQEAERRRLEDLDKQREAQREREFLAEAALWDKVDGAKTAGPLEDYLRRYPSGRFAELAQLQLDELLRRAGEKKVEVVTSTQNPYTQGSARADLAFKVGDTYTYVRRDRDTKEMIGKANNTVSAVTETQVIFNDGRLILDRLGNIVKLPDGRTFTPRQDQQLDYALGKKWSTRFSMRNEQQNLTSEAEYEFRITRREKVTVPAGTFDCWLIEGNGWSTTGQGVRVRLGSMRWMAPDRCRRPIISESFRRLEGFAIPSGKALKKAGQFLNNERLELVAFNQS